MVPGPSTSLDPLTTPTAPRPVVEAFLDALADSDLERAGELIADEIAYVNVGLPAIRGRTRVLRALAIMDRPSASFEVCVHAISVDGPTVLTERTDVLSFGRFRSQFWVTGRFDVVDGRITLWRDSFDYLDLVRATGRGLAAMVVPSWQPSAPVRTDAPGRPKRH